MSEGARLSWERVSVAPVVGDAHEAAIVRCWDEVDGDATGRG